MGLRSYSLALAASPAKRLSDVYGDGTGVVNAANDIPYRQIVLSALGATGYVGSASTVTTSTGTPVAVGTPVTLGPFATGPMKLSDFYGIGAGATLNILGVPF